MIPPGARPARGAGFALEELDGEYVGYDPRSQRVVELNATAAMVLQLCDGARTVEDIVGLVADAYPEERPRVEREVKDALEAFAANGAVTLLEST